MTGVACDVLGMVPFALAFHTGVQVLAKSRLEFALLGKIWGLSDIDEDGYLDDEEVCVGRANRSGHGRVRRR